MRTRAISAIGVIIAGLVPSLLGGPVFLVLMGTLTLVGWLEYATLSARLPFAPRIPPTGGLAILGMLLAGYFNWPAPVIVGMLAITFAAPLVAQFTDPTNPGAISGWALAVAGSLYLGIPALSATWLRSLQAPVSAGWMQHLSDRTALAWPSAPAGLSWTLVVILVTWIADTAAYLVGRSVGRHKLAPRLSPNKTIEGALGGLAGAVLVSLACFSLFGLPGGPLWAVISGLLLGVAGQIGDLSESLMKRQAGVKDSGDIIPGHGGILDRIDALLFAFPVGWMLAVAISALGR
ncbi:MAG: phosphatidate cytidylyltransferase [Thermomicrobiales bacterium]